ncbi:MAG: histidinol dehydrogenase [Spirochaetales bacterium]|nr:histidinol dehydrogenase [Spirochaetales bacterium]
MTVPVHFWRDLSSSDRERIFARSEQDIADVASAVTQVLNEVKNRGDAALRDFALRFDGADLHDKSLLVSPEEYKVAENLLTENVKEALRYAISNVKKFHQSQIPQTMAWVEVRPGLLAGERPLPIDSVGLYVPRGRGSFPSMVYMQAIPANMAGVKRIVMVSPPLPDGSIDPACLYAAQLCGVHEFYKVGGAQAVGALTFGTESIAPVVKVTGPGSRWVAAAKRQVSHRIDVGLPAGPSEAAILADSSAFPWKLALDLMVEAEHGSDSSVLLVTDSPELARQTAQYVGALAEGLEEPRKTFVRDVFSGYGAILVCSNIEEGAQIINDFAPEHLSIQTREPFTTLHLIRNASEILLGDNLPFSGANYAAGPNAILPTGGNAKTFGPLSVRDFIKFSSVIFATGTAYDELKSPVTVLSDYEGFKTHADAFRKRGEH